MMPSNGLVVEVAAQRRRHRKVIFSSSPLPYKDRVWRLVGQIGPGSIS